MGSWPGSEFSSPPVRTVRRAPPGQAGWQSPSRGAGAARLPGERSGAAAAPGRLPRRPPRPLGGELVRTARASPGTSSNDDGGGHMGKGTVPAERSPGVWHRRPLPVLVLSAPPPAPRVSPLTPLPPNHARLVPAVARKGLGVRDMTHPGGKGQALRAQLPGSRVEAGRGSGERLTS